MSPIEPFQDFTNSTYDRPQDPVVSVPGGAVKPWPVNEDGSWDTSEEEPMVTMPSLRQRRKVLSLCVVAFTIGSLLIILASPYKNEFFAPGPLHSSHAQLLANQGTDRCAACHSGSSDSAFGWVAHAFSGASKGSTQSELCMECHKATIPESNALNPHNVSPSQLAAKTNQFRSASFAKKILPSPVNADNEIACSSCHREHKGSQDLKAMTDAQCQTCHQSSFHSFEKDHPEFTNWKVESKQTIAFDHSTHLAKHFPKSGKAFACSQCHLDDATQNVKIQAPFEQACASCHEQKIVDSGIDGFALLTLPMLDMQAIEKQKLDAGTWPLAATGDFDGPLPPAMRLLLMADPEAEAILASRPPSFEFSDLDPGVEADVKEAVALAWSIKRLVYELGTQGVGAAKSRFDKALARNLTDGEVYEMLSGLNSRSFAAAARRWFPNLKVEIEARPRLGAIPARQREPDRHRLSRQKESERATQISRLSLTPKMLAKITLQEPLAKNPLAEIDETSKATQSTVEHGGLPSPALPDELEVPDFATEDSPTRDEVARPVNYVPDDPSQRGWTRDDQKLSIFYRPVGHEDRVLKHWIDAVVATPDADRLTATSGLFHMLTNLNSIGDCRSCHTLKRNDESVFFVNWSPNRRSTIGGQFTRFSHRPHLVQPVLQDCSHCHQLNKSISNRDSFNSLDLLEYTSNFHAIKKANCITCHRKGLTDNSCTTCHDYHVGGHKPQH